MGYYNLVHKLIDLYVSMMIIGVGDSGASFARWLGVHHGWGRDSCIDMLMGKMVGVSNILWNFIFATLCNIFFEDKNA